MPFQKQKNENQGSLWHQHRGAFASRVPNARKYYTSHSKYHRVGGVWGELQTHFGTGKQANQIIYFFYYFFQID